MKSQKILNHKTSNQVTSRCIQVLFLSTLALSIISCEDDWLDAKPEKSLVVPSKISDYQALLDNNDGAGGTAPFNTQTNTLGEMGAGDFFVSDASWVEFKVVEKNTYTWAPDIYGADKEYDVWSYAYNNILYTNVILEGIEEIDPANNELAQWNQVKGSALFFRSYRNFDMAQTFCKSYDNNTAASDLGIPLRLKSDINAVSRRSSVKETYEQITSDLKKAVNLLPFETPINITYKLRPTKTAAYAMLARVYLAMALYDSAFVYANKALQLHDDLMDYSVIPAGRLRIPRFNEEVILSMTGSFYLVTSPFHAMPEPDLYASYDINDRRRDLFWPIRNGAPRFYGSYDQTTTLFTGLATDEMYLIRAECYARAGNKDAALDDLNTLIETRWIDNGTWTPFTATDADDALDKILIERRKELVFRCLRWSDLRRLNKEPQYEITLTRTINETVYTLPPNSPLYVLPIPPDVIQITGMQQNPR